MSSSSDFPDRDRENESLREQIKKLEGEAAQLREQNQILQTERNSFAKFVPPELLDHLTHEGAMRFYRDAERECTLELRDVLAEIEGMADESR
jgi:hypothetical protein